MRDDTRLVPFAAWHIAELKAALGSSRIAPDLSSDKWRDIEDDSRACTLLYRCQPIACGGLITHWPGRAIGWLIIAPLPRMALWGKITRIVRQTLAGAPYHRIEATVRSDFAAGHRWIREFGFEPEGLMRKYGPDKADHWLYARVVE